MLELMKIPAMLAVMAALTACGSDTSVVDDTRSSRRPSSALSDEKSADDDGETEDGAPPDATDDPPGGDPGGDKGSDAGSGSGAGDGPEQLCVDTINEYRKSLKLPPLERWTSAESCSSQQALSDGQKNQPHGAFSKCGEFAQNECPGWPGPPDKMIGGCLKAMWSEGPGGGHYEAMASKQWKKVACGFATVSSGKVWSVQNFR